MTGQFPGARLLQCLARSVVLIRSDLKRIAQHNFLETQFDLHLFAPFLSKTKPDDQMSSSDPHAASCSTLRRAVHFAATASGPGTVPSSSWNDGVIETRCAGSVKWDLGKAATPRTFARKPSKGRKSPSAIVSSVSYDPREAVSGGAQREEVKPSFLSSSQHLIR